MPPAAHDYLTMVTQDCNDSWGNAIQFTRRLNRVLFACCQHSFYNLPGPRLGPQTGELCLEYGEYFKCLQGVLGEVRALRDFENVQNL